jgi:predicted DNA-binding transcriptional regulator AlpA
MSNPNQPEPVFVRSSWPMQRYGYSRTTIWRRVKNGTFPAPRYLPGGQRRWLLADLLEWERLHLGASGAKP